MSNFEEPCIKDDAEQIEEQPMKTKTARTYPCETFPNLIRFDPNKPDHEIVKRGFS